MEIYREQDQERKNTVPILDGYDLGELIELRTRLRDVFGKLGWYLEHVERRIAKIMESGKAG